ncbi:alkaline phosphatase, partial [bacterium]|nr:alkaline phosphatase [candidate division CSSED10-310 bacterium]
MRSLVVGIRRFMLMVLPVMMGLTWPAIGSVDSAGRSDDGADGIRNVILVIGDGMGFPAIGLLRQYAMLAPASIYRDREGITALEQTMREGQIGLLFTDPFGALVPDSAAAASQMATGRMSLLECIGGDSQGEPIETVLECATRLGKATGLVSDTRITHATPASFASHVFHRSEESEIARQLVHPVTGPDVMLSGGLRYFVPRSYNQASGDSEPGFPVWSMSREIPFAVKSKRSDAIDLVDRAIKEAGYDVVFTREALAAA